MDIALKAELEEIDAFLLENGPWDPPIESVEVPIPNPLRGIWRGVSEFLFAMAPKPLNEGEEKILYEAERKRKLQRRDQILKELAEKEPKLAKANQEVEDLEAKVGEAEEKLEECEDDDDKDKTNKTIKRFNPRGL